MADWRKPGRAARIVIHEEAGEIREYWRAGDGEDDVRWQRVPPAAAADSSAEGMTTEQLLEAISASVRERRRASRGRKFRMPFQ